MTIDILHVPWARSCACDGCAVTFDPLFDYSGRRPAVGKPRLYCSTRCLNRANYLRRKERGLEPRYRPHPPVMVTA